ncbi:uncharacterized protein LOC123396143 [Hordeum vulgare subsp. vulgare]|uniref:Uncharacterized protein n=1 Tax=Hordeum vulgare subsp. vulgare TaxID=112509 RepID=A0A8I7B9H1_HORVV|nr:uncharacterized protein LOC123396143 [Hordeum vulgare subsp. vulgare]KAI4988934.1 hypothetical protein ZWY2020_036251 [Hordeum vulgare]
MPSLRQCSTLVVAIDRQLLGHLSATKMKIAKAPVLLKKAVTMCKSKTGVLAARLLMLASLRRRMATVGVMSHKIHALMVAADRAKAGGDCHKAVVPHKLAKTLPANYGGEIVDLTHELSLFSQEEDDGGFPDWTLHPIFNDDDNCCYPEEDDDVVGDVLLDGCDGHHDEPSVIDLIRSNREVQGLEFNVEDEIDQAADMFIRRFRERMSKSI